MTTIEVNLIRSPPGAAWSVIDDIVYDAAGPVPLWRVVGLLARSGYQGRRFEVYDEGGLALIGTVRDTGWPGGASSRICVGCRV